MNISNQIYVYKKIINRGETYFLSLKLFKSLFVTTRIKKFDIHGYISRTSPSFFIFTIARVETRNSYIKNFDGRCFQ